MSTRGADPLPLYRIEVRPRSEDTPADRLLAERLREGGLARLQRVQTSRVYLVEAAIDRRAAETQVAGLLADPVTEQFTVWQAGEPLESGFDALEVHLKPGVMDPVAETALAELQARGVTVGQVRTVRRYRLAGENDAKACRSVFERLLANDCIEDVQVGARAETAATPRERPFQLRRVALRELDEAGLLKLSRSGHLFLTLAEMQTIQARFRELQRDPTDLELETLAQTWSEHCVHKTLKSAVVYRGAALPGQPSGEARFDNLLKDTIARATRELMAAGRGPECLSVFVDNAGVIAFDDEFGVAFKVETHNRPSAIEPYGGAATGVGGCIRDVLGCGLGARPIANTDVFCVAPCDWPADELPRGVLHPQRVLRGVAAGVADYGNRMGIPTVNGAVHFDPRYLGNPLVYCGCVGLIPRRLIHKSARPGDRIVVIGGRTGRDGIHGATFSSAELTDTHADEFSHAVQIGNAITEKRCLEAVLRARDDAGGPLFNAVTDCGAGGLSSAVGEMGAEIGAEVELSPVPLKYRGLRYDEIWISEAQERMVLAVPPAKLDAFLAACQAEETEATVIGTFGLQRDGRAWLTVKYRGEVVGDLDMHFIHEGLPRGERNATWSPPPVEPNHRAVASAELRDHAARLLAQLARPTVASKEGIIRQYDHEVQGGSVVKPLIGRGAGPGDAAVLRPRLESQRGIALGVGLAPQRGGRDPYWMALGALDEAIRNVVAVGGDPGRTAVLDNFCWPRTDDERVMGSLVRACQACYDGAIAYGTPFISGKDSLSNEFVLDPADRQRVAAQLERYAEREQPFDPELAADLRRSAAHVLAAGRLRIPATLLISAVSLIDDVRRCVTSDLKRPGATVVRVGGLPPFDFDLAAAARIHAAVAGAIAAGRVAACHDISEGGWLTGLAEMALGGQRGVVVAADVLNGAAGRAAFDEVVAGYLIEPRGEADVLLVALGEQGVTGEVVAGVEAEPRVTLGVGSIPLSELRRAWSG